MLSTTDLLRLLRTHIDWKEKGILCKWKSKESGEAINTDRQNRLLWEKDGQYIMIKGSIQEDVTAVTIYTPNARATQYVRQMLTAIKEKLTCMHCYV